MKMPDWQALSGEFERTAELVGGGDFDVEKYLKAYRNTPTAEMSQPTMPSNAVIAASFAETELSKDEKTFETIARNMKNYLKRHRMREALDYFHNSVFKEIQTNGSVVAFDLVQAIGERLQRLLEYRFRTFNVCVQMLIELCSVISDKELHIIFLAELEKDWKIRKTKKKMLEEDYDDQDNEDFN